MVGQNQEKKEAAVTARKTCVINFHSHLYFWNLIFFRTSKHGRSVKISAPPSAMINGSPLTLFHKLFAISGKGEKALRILATLEAKTANFWTFCTVILLKLHVSKICMTPFWSMVYRVCYLTRHITLPDTCPLNSRFPCTKLLIYIMAGIHMRGTWTM